MRRPTAATARPLLLPLLVLLAAASVGAYPELWATKKAPDCTAHPSKRYDGHAAPGASPDEGIAFLLAGGGSVPRLCRGAEPVGLTITFPQSRNALVTVAGGGAALSGDAVVGAGEACAGVRALTQSPLRTLSLKLAAPKEGGGDASAVVKVTSARGRLEGFQYSTLTLPVVDCDSPAAAGVTAAAGAPEPSAAVRAVTARAPAAEAAARAPAAEEAAAAAPIVRTPVAAPALPRVASAPAARPLAPVLVRAPRAPAAEAAAATRAPAEAAAATRAPAAAAAKALVAALRSIFSRKPSE